MREQLECFTRMDHTTKKRRRCCPDLLGLLLLPLTEPFLHVGIHALGFLHVTDLVMSSVRDAIRHASRGLLDSSTGRIAI